MNISIKDTVMFAVVIFGMIGFYTLVGKLDDWRKARKKNIE